MQTIQWNGTPGTSNLQIREVDTPVPTTNHVLLRMKAWSLNYRDLLVVDGAYGKNLPNPLTILSDGVGEVMDAGTGVSAKLVGKRVAVNFFPDWTDGPCDALKAKNSLGGSCQGMLAEHICAHKDSLVEIPDYLSDEEAATLPCAALTAWNALFETGRLLPGNSVLTMGCGGVSLFALQFAYLHQMKSFAVSRSAENIIRLNQLGLDHGICTNENPEWGDLVRKASGGGVDLSLELIGASALPETMKATRMGGEISLIGVLGGNQETFNPLPMIMKSLRMSGIFVGSKAMFQRMLKAMEKAKLKPVIHKTFNWKEVQQGLEYMKKGNHFGKLCLRKD